MQPVQLDRHWRHVIQQEAHKGSEQEEKAYRATLAVWENTQMQQGQVYHLAGITEK